MKNKSNKGSQVTEIKYLPRILMFSLLLLSATAVAQNVGINDDNSDPHASAMLDVKSANKGFLPPRMTRSQRNQIASPANGLIVFCTDCATNGALCIYIYDKWMTMTFCHTDAPTAGTNIPGNNHITWKWNSVAGASGYKWNTSNNYATATDMGTNTSKLETGLVPGETYTRYVWAVNSDCGESEATMLVQSTLNTGMSYGGGIIFYIDGSGEHGLIATTADQSTAAVWGCEGTMIGGLGNDIGTGHANTINIVNECTGDINGPTAAEICNNLVLNGYSDWYLPSIEELIALYEARNAVGGFSGNYYWSSSQESSTTALGLDFSDSYVTPNFKEENQYVRAIRNF